MQVNIPRRIRLKLTDRELDDVAEALDNPDIGERAKKKLLVITMHAEGAQHGFIESCLRGRQKSTAIISRTSYFLDALLDTERVSTGDEARAHVWFLTPDVYPHTLWVGRVLTVAEGSRPVGSATIVDVFNPVLKRKDT